LARGRSKTVRLRVSPDRVSQPEQVCRPHDRRRSGFDRLVTALLLLLFATLMVLAATQLLWRLLPKTAAAPWLGSSIAAVVLWLVMIGAIQATGRAAHVRIQVLERWLPPTAATAAWRLVLALTAVICLALASSTTGMVFLEYEFLGRSFPGLPAWLVLAIVPVGFVVMGLRFLVRAVAARS